MERAEAVMDKVAKKVEKGKAKERVVKERSVRAHTELWCLLIRELES